MAGFLARLFGGRQARAEQAREWISKATEHLRADRYKQALSCFERALKCEPKNAVAWLGKGAALAGLHRTQEAVECLRQARDLLQSEAGSGH